MATEVANRPEFSKEITRHNYQEVLHMALQYQSFDPLSRFIQDLPDTDFTKCIQEDCKRDQGQIWMAFRPQYFNSWGKPYVGSCCHAHRHRHSWNFKDQSLKAYEGSHFQLELEKLNQVFAMMSEPKPSCVAKESLHANGGMSTVFNNPNTTCWTSGSVITLHNGNDCPIENLLPGMQVKTYDPVNRQVGISRIDYVIREPCVNGVCRAVSLGDRGKAILTSNHPILTNLSGVRPSYQWPQNIGKPSSVVSDYVYNMVLDDHHHVFSDGEVCVTWGHGMTEDKVNICGFDGLDIVPHNYFGNMTLVRNDLLTLTQGVNDYIEIDPTIVKRDPCNGWITSLV
jgi:hypothetical protein